MYLYVFINVWVSVWCSWAVIENAGNWLKEKMKNWKEITLFVVVVLLKKRSERGIRI